LNRLELLWSESFFAGSLAQLIARLTGLPAVVLLLTVGLVIGRAGFNLVEPETLGRGLQPLVGLLVSLVLFDGGLNLRLAGRDLQRTVVQLVVVRGVLGLLGGALLAHQLAGLAWPLAWVFAAISLATGPTVVTPMVQQMRLLPGLGQILQAEGLILEPIGAVLALLLLQLALGDLAGWADVVSLLGLRVGGGVAIGATGGLLLSLVLEHLPRGSGTEQEDPLPLQLILGALFLLVSGAEWLLPEAGFPAAVAAGVVVGLRLDKEASQLDELIAQLAQLAITVLFPLLAADLSWAELSPLGLGGVGCVLALMLYRWIVIQLGSIGLPGLGWSEKLILSWIAPRGVVTAAVASLFALQLEAAGVAGASDLKGLVFLMIVLTVGLQGFTAPSLARRLGLVLESEPPAIAPLGGELKTAVLMATEGVESPAPQPESPEPRP
jgi:NhaP-type Na+/H+ or K+/H+ antiporter